MTDSFDLDRFVRAQAPVFDQALAEMRAGEKRSHWMWFVFPQIAGLGRSAMSRRYAIASLAEARAWLAHPLLGGRLRACLDVLDRLPGSDPVRIFGPVDAMKLRSSLTLFEAAGGGDAFGAALERWFGAERDPATQALLAQG